LNKHKKEMNEKENIDYNFYLKLINNSTLFANFFFNGFNLNNRKILSSKKLNYNYHLPLLILKGM